MPDRTTVLWLWQEGSEAVELAAESLDHFEAAAESLELGAAEDLKLRLNHQWLAARAWRAMDLFIWSQKVKTSEAVVFDERDAWKAWARDELVQVKGEMEEAGLAGIDVASPGRIQEFLDGVPNVEAEPLEPSGLSFSPIRFAPAEEGGWTVAFSTNEPAQVAVDYGLELPDYGFSTTVFSPGNEAPVMVSLPDLEPDRRYVVRLRAAWDGSEFLGGDWWLFTRN